jgi:(S)-ureidoglycine---glyoxylate transaminase
MAAPPFAADDPCHAAVLAELTYRLRQVFCTQEATAVAMPGASRSGIEAVLNSLIEPDDRVLVGVFGHFGELLCTLAARHGARVRRVDVEWGQHIDPEMMIQAMLDWRPKLAALVHADTSTGIVQPLREIGRACQESETVFLVDAVLSVGGCEINMDAWGIDAVVGGMQKCLGGPPGLAPLAYSDRAAASFSSKPHSAYLDVRRVADTWHNPQPETELPTPMLLALREALRIIDEEGLEARWQRHARAGRAVRAGLDAMGLQRFGDPAHAAPMITLVRVPDGIGDLDVRQQLLEQHGVEIMAAFGPLRGQVWRIGTMGTNAALASVLHVLASLDAVLNAQGFATPRGAGVDAAAEAFV